MTWSETAVEIGLEYGIRNISGNVIDSTCFIVRLDQTGAIGVRTVQEGADKSADRLPEFLAGEIFRETRRWAEAMDAWLDDEALETDRASALAMVSALLACPIDDMRIETVKDLHEPGCLQKIAVAAAGETIEITPFGVHGANLFMKSAGLDGLRRHVHQEHDLREEGARARHATARVVKSAWYNACRIMLLPFAWALHLLDTNRDMSDLDVAPELAERSRLH